MTDICVCKLILFDSVTGYLMANAVVLNSDRNSQSNAQSQNGFSAINNASVDKDKTPMCLVNELARFNKVFIDFIMC